MNAGRIIKICFYFTVAILVLKGVQVACNKYLPNTSNPESDGAHNQFRLDFKDINIPKTDEPKADGPTADRNDDMASLLTYDFKNMLNLIEACEKVKYLEYLRYSRPKEACDINPETLQALVRAMHNEKSKLKKHIAEIKSCSRDSIPSKQLKALKYYLRVIEVNLQDLKGIGAGKNED